MRTVTIRRSVIALAAAAALLAGCGDGGDGGGEPESTGPTDNGVSALAPDEILSRATTALKEAKSYRIKGSIKVDDGKMDLDLRVAGSDVGGKLSQNGATVELLSVGGQQYIRPDATFWQQNLDSPEAARNVVKLMGDKWAKVPAENKDFADLFGVASVDELLKPDGSLTKGETRDIDGVQTIGLVDTSAKGGTIYIATTGKPYPIALQSKDVAEGQLTFSDFGATFDDVQAPPEAQVVDFEELRRK